MLILYGILLFVFIQDLRMSCVILLSRTKIKGQGILFAATRSHCNVSSSRGPKLQFEVLSSLGPTLRGKVSPLMKLKYHAMCTPLENTKYKVFEATPIQGRHLFTSTLVRHTQNTECPMSWSLHFQSNGPSTDMVVLSE